MCHKLLPSFRQEVTCRHAQQSISFTRIHRTIASDVMCRDVDVSYFESSMYRKCQECKIVHRCNLSVTPWVSIFTLSLR